MSIAIILTHYHAPVPCTRSGLHISGVFVRTKSVIDSGSLSGSFDGMAKSVSLSWCLSPSVLAQSPPHHDSGCPQTSLLLGFLRVLHSHTLPHCPPSTPHLILCILLKFTSTQGGRILLSLKSDRPHVDDDLEQTAYVFGSVPYV